jgi:hypothetical protein
MNDKKSMTRFKVFILGAINGLIVGLALEQARLAYLNYQMSQAAKDYAQSDIFVDFIQARWEPFLPLFSIVVFGVVAYFIYEFFLNHARLLLMLWFGLGIFALSLGYFMSTLNPDMTSLIWLFGLVVVAYLVHRLWKSHPDSPPALWPVVAISAVTVVGVGVQLAGLFFYWPDLRRPLIWLVCLVGAVVISAVFGVVVQLISNRFKWKEI